MNGLDVRLYAFREYNEFSIILIFSGAFHWNVCSGWPEFMFRLKSLPE